MKILTVVGARPQFVKAAMVSRALTEHNKKGKNIIDEHILHTGQHYDKNMSSVFFDDMHIPAPRYRIECGGLSHGEMTGRMMIEIEKIVHACKPDKVLVYGDTNSTLAGALVASKMNIPIVHVEAGLRSYNRTMPEEINRILTDHMSAILCCPTYRSVENLKSEGIAEGVHHVGDVMYDAALLFGSVAESTSDILTELNLTPQRYYLATVHRAENTSDKERLSNIFEALTEISTDSTPVVLPLHPATSGYLQKYGLSDFTEKNKSVKLIEPVNFTDMIMLEKNAKYILTDSGGIQKEAYFHHVPCLTLREETEWIETVNAGWNTIVGYKKESIINALSSNTQKYEISEYGDGHTGDKIVQLIAQ